MCNIIIFQGPIQRYLEDVANNEMAINNFMEKVLESRDDFNKCLESAFAVGGHSKDIENFIATKIKVLKEKEIIDEHECVDHDILEPVYPENDYEKGYDFVVLLLE